MSNPFQLPSLSASLPSSASWHGREGHPAGNGAQSSSFRASREALSIDVRRPGHDSKLPSLSGQLGDYQATRHALAEASSAGLVSPSVEEPSQAGRKPAKAHVPSACLNCKRAHLACDVGRPCRRCVNLGKSDTCIDVQHKKRGRPRLKDRPSSQTGIPTLQTLDGKSDVSGSPASASYARHSPGSEAGYFRSPIRGMDLLSPPLLASTSVMQVAGRTHGAHAHPRSASTRSRLQATPTLVPIIFAIPWMQTASTEVAIQHPLGRISRTAFRVRMRLASQVRLIRWRLASTLIPNPTSIHTIHINSINSNSSRALDSSSRKLHLARIPQQAHLTQRTVWCRL